MKRALIVTLAVFVLLFVAVGIWWHEMNIVPNVSMPKPPPAPSPNAYDFFVAAYALDRDSGKWNFAAGTRPPGYKDPTDPDDRDYSLAEQEALLNENQPMIAKVRQGLPYDYSPTNAKPPDFFDKNLACFREETRLLSFAGKVYGEEGKWSKAITSELDCEEFGGKVDRNDGLIGRLVAIACQAIGRRHAWDAVDHLSGDDARAGALRLEGIVKSRYPVSDTLSNEKPRTDYMLVHIFKVRGRMGTVPGATQTLSDSPLTTEQVWKLLFTSKREVAQQVDRYMDAYINRSKFSYGAAMRMRAIPFPPNLMSRAMVTDLNQVLFKDAVNDTENDLLMTSLALRAYKVDHGDYPASLNDLVPRYLHVVPADPYASRGPISYHKGGTKYVLYSVGPDGVDNGGTPIVNPKYTGQLRTMVERDSKGDMVAGVNFN